MVEKCPKCGSTYSKYPLRDTEGKYIWKNLFKMDWYSIMWLLVVLFLIYGYYHDTEECRIVLEDPIEYCKTSNACKIIFEESIAPSNIQDENIHFEILTP